jgi:hypothetical protein
MSFQFPNSPAVNDSFTPVGGPTYTWDGVAWKMAQALGQTAQSYNRIVNGAMQHSQENGDSTSTIAGFYPADQWSQNFSGLTMNIGRSLSVPATGNRRIGFNFGVGKVPAAGEFSLIDQKIEGNRIADLQWGTANAKQIIVRFWTMTTTTPGTYTFSIRNYGGGTPNRTYLAPFTLAAINTWTLVTLVIPGDTTGTWNIDSALGMDIALSMASGSSLQGVPGWQAGNLLALTTATNGTATVNNTFYFGDVGLYADPNNTGVPPPWVTPDYASELAACKRYWQLSANLTLSHYNTAGSYGMTTIPFTIEMRTAPTIAVQTSGTLSNTSVVIADTQNTLGLGRFGCQATATGASSVSGRVLLYNARM